MDNEADRYSCYAETLNQCDKEINDIYHDYAMRHDLTDAALWVLYALYEMKERMTQADICNSWFYSRQTINTALKGLERQGVIELTSVPGNRKSKNVVFTAKGMDMARRIIEPLKQAENQVFAAFSEEENRLFIELMRKRCCLLQKFLKTEYSLSSED